jgi:hypothetical protein
MIALGSTPEQLLPPMYRPDRAVPMDVAFRFIEYRILPYSGPLWPTFSDIPSPYNPEYLPQ